MRFNFLKNREFFIAAPSFYFSCINQALEVSYMQCQSPLERHL